MFSSNYLLLPFRVSQFENHSFPEFVDGGNNVADTSKNARNSQVWLTVLAFLSFYLHLPSNIWIHVYNVVM